MIQRAIGSYVGDGNPTQEFDTGLSGTVTEVLLMVEQLPGQNPLYSVEAWKLATMPGNQWGAAPTGSPYPPGDGIAINGSKVTVNGAGFNSLGDKWLWVAYSE